MKRIKTLKILGLIAAVALVFAACNQVTGGDPGEEGSDPAASILNLGAKRVGVDPTSWTISSGAPFANMGISTINGVASNGSTVVAVGGTATNAYAATSTDGGITWTNQTTALPALTRNPSVINYLNGNYLVNAGNRVTAGAYSPNATPGTWSATGNIGFGTKGSTYGIDSNNDVRYVVSGQNGEAAFTTSLGTAFTMIPQTVTGWSGTGSTAYINAAAYGQVGTTPTFVFGGGSGRIAYTDTISSTGSWGTATEPFATDEFVNVIVYGNGIFVAVGGPDAAPGISGKAAYSKDGITWTQAKFPLGNEVAVYALAFGNGYFVAGDDAGYIAYSRDGQNWSTPLINPVFSGGDPINALTYDSASDQFIAVGGTSAPLVAYTN
jgi:hypothetical protein